MFVIYKALLRKTVKALEEPAVQSSPENVLVCGVSQILRKFVPQSWCRSSEITVTNLCQLACLRQKPWLSGHWCWNVTKMSDISAHSYSEICEKD